VREPVARPLDVVGIELLLTASQAFLTGVLMYLAIGIWDDRGVGLGPVAIILALLGLAVGGSWLYWLLGGVGWPMAAANTPAAMFLGFALVLGLAGDLTLRVEGVPLLFAVAAAVYGIVGGVFIDSPRRWRWDQRQKPRDGSVPLVSETTRAVVAAVPRTIPRRAVPEEPSSELATRIEAATPADVGTPADAAPSSPAGLDDLASDDLASADVADRDDADEVRDPASPELVTARAMPTERLAGRESASTSAPEDDPDGIELPTAIEPRAQRSPWAWAAPPEWNRDDDEPASGSGDRP
jgi:hypothetical protein